jgi:hypothetical protein
MIHGQQNVKFKAMYSVFPLVRMTFFLFNPQSIAICPRTFSNHVVSTNNMLEIHPVMRHLFHLNHQQLIIDTGDCAGY